MDPQESPEQSNFVEEESNFRRSEAAVDDGADGEVQAVADDDAQQQQQQSGDQGQQSGQMQSHMEDGGAASSSSSMSDSGAQGLRNLIINYLPPTITQDVLFNMFHPFGEIEHHKLITDRHTGQSMGYGFVLFKNASSAQEAINALNGVQVGTKKLKVSYAASGGGQLRQGNLYIGNLDSHVTAETLKGMFEPYGEIVDHKILTNQQTGESRGIGFVRFATRDQAVSAIASLNNSTFQGNSQPLIVKFANDRSRNQRGRVSGPGGGYLYQGGMGRGNRYDPYGGGGFGGQPGGYFPNGGNMGYQNAAPVGNVAQPPGFTPFNSGGRGMGMGMGGGRGMEQPGTSLFVYNIPQESDDSLLLRLFGSYGQVTHVKVVRDQQTNTCRGFGFVTFANPSDAAQAIATLNGCQLQGKVLQVSYKKK